MKKSIVLLVLSLTALLTLLGFRIHYNQQETKRRLKEVNRKYDIVFEKEADVLEKELDEYVRRTKNESLELEDKARREKYIQLLRERVKIYRDIYKE